ncbi:RagB/SusD family nutrient uptake outer membrane protein [Carboxylicivirga taeanensis]|uniref:RagB/SusD family nutrient uptake outer membrane protein n=1 Tax=Carboxylicivirga taeanensis TaxID=1416875 RepID=UPI003F6E3152
MKKILYLLIIVGGLTACSDFLEEQSQDLTAVESTEHFAALLLQEFSNEYAMFSSVYYMTDELEEVATTSISYKDNKTTYTWQQEIEIDEDGNTVVPSINSAWGNAYEDIAITNYVIESIDNMEGNEQEKLFVKGEAHFIRALSYFNLLNLYGQPFNSGTKDTDLGVPLRTGTDVQVVMKRSSVEQGYVLIEQDLSDARQLLATSGLKKSKWHPSPLACDLLMSRVKLYQEKWDDAIEYADRVINNGQLAVMPVSGAFITQGNPEVLYAWHKTYNSKLGVPSSNKPLGYSTPQALLDLYENGDKRRSLFFVSFSMQGGTYHITNKNAPGYEGTNSDDVYTTFGYQNMRVAEAYLNKAEALAQKQDATAIEVIKELHATRFNDVSGLVYPVSLEEVLAYVYDERYRELCYEDHHRWFDLRRMKEKDPIKHVYTTLDSEGEVSKTEVFVLESDDLNYTLPLPIQERENNPAIINNERNDKVSTQ